MKKLYAFILAVVLLTLCSCTEVTRVDYNLGQQADNFNIEWQITVFNTRTDTVLFQMTGVFSLQNSGANELEVICEVKMGEYRKHFIYLSQDTTYVVEDLGGANVDQYHYELNFLPQMIGGVTITSND